MPPRPDAPPLIAHVVDHFEAGGLENGLINLLNEMPHGAYRHAVVCVKGYSSFRQRIRRDDVPFIALSKRPGTDPAWYGRLWGALRTLRPDIVHTRNLGTIEAQAVAAAAGRAARIHGEHGREIWDLDGTRRKYTWLRKAMRPCIDRYIAVSGDLERWLTTIVKVPESKVTRIYNGVDTERFRPGLTDPRPGATATFTIGTVGRMRDVKDQLTLARAFLRLLAVEPSLRQRIRLTMVGDGPLRARCLELLAEGGAADLCHLPGSRNDIPDILRSLDVFVLPSIAEGTSNTLLEAMATALPVVATAVGGNSELVVPGTTGALVPPGDHVAMANAIRSYIENPAIALGHGVAGRARAEAQFSLRTMVDAYLNVYAELS
jgi:sugar transferase (PEP-CTERM/EpsH1 system associated)